MKVLYVKNGDAVEQVRKLSGVSGGEISSGTEAFISELLMHNASDRFLVLSRSALPDRVEYNHIKAINFGLKSKWFPSIVMRFFTDFAILLAGLCFRPDRVVCGCTGGRLWAAYLVSIVFRVPLVHSRHNLIWGEETKIFRRASNFLDLWVLKRVKGVVCHGPFLAHQVKALRDQGVFEFDLSFKDLDEKLMRGQDNLARLTQAYFSSDSPFILFVGRMEINKGIMDLLNAFLTLADRYPEFHLAFVGVGGGLEQVRKKIATAAGGQRVHLLGRKEHSDVLTLMQAAKLVVCPTRADFPEGRCMVAMEAQVLGVPVIAPRFGPFPFLVEDGVNGLLFEPDSESDLTNKMQQMLGSAELFAQLKAGSVVAGRALLTPPLTFNQAVQKAFES